MGPLAGNIALSRAEFALFAIITVFGLWILFPVVTPFVQEIRLFFKPHDKEKITIVEAPKRSGHEAPKEASTETVSADDEPDYQVWAQRETLTIFEASRLLAGIEPTARGRPARSNAYADLLVEALELDNLPRAYKSQFDKSHTPKTRDEHVDYEKAHGSIDLLTSIRLQDLIKYLETKKIADTFLKKIKLHGPR